MTDPQHGNQPGGPYVSPEEAARQQLIAAGYDPNSTGFWDALQNMVAKAEGTQAATQRRTEQTRQLSQDVDYRSGIQPSDAEYLSYPHEQLQQMVQTVNPGQVTGVSSSWTQLANAMATFGQQLSGAANSSGATWKGDAAESAFNFVSGLGQWSDDSGRAAQLAADQVYNQSAAAETAKNSMPEPIPFSWSDEIKSWAGSNPLDIVDNVNKSLDKQKESQEAHTQAAQVMSNYDNNLYSAASKAPAFSPPPTFVAPTGGAVGSIGSAIVGGTGAAAPNPGGNIGASGGAKNSIAGNPAAAPAGTGSSLGSLGNTPSTPTLQTGTRTGGASSSASSSPGSTSAQNFAPGLSGSSSGTSSGLGDSGLGAMAGMPMGGMGGMSGVDADEYSSKLGRGGSGGSFGPGGSGSAAGSGSAGAGAQTGARAGGAGAAESAAGGAGGRGAASSGAGRGAMGAGAGAKGKGEEDEEHQRPSWLIEPDPDDVFGSSERTAPPVIGE